MERTYNLTAIVLRGHPFNEADRILVLMSLEAGLKRVVAKGLRKPKSRMGGRLEPLRETEMMVAKGRNLDVVAQAEILRPFPDVQRDYEALASAMSAAELLMAFLEEGDPAPEVYALFTELLGLLGPGVEAEVLLTAFELQLMDLVGYRPELERCIGCESPLTAETVAGLAIEGGGAVCSRCEAPGPVLRLSPGAWQMLSRLQKTPLAECRRLSGAGRLMSACRHAMKAYMSFRAERELRAQRMFDWQAAVT